MSIRFISPKVHGVLDYVAAAGLIGYPFLLDLGSSGPVALWFSVVAGVGLIAYSLLTDYAFSVSSVFSFKAHLWLDVIAGAAFIAAIFVFGFKGLTAGYYAVMGLGVFALVAVTNLGDTPTSENRNIDGLTT